MPKPKTLSPSQRQMAENAQPLKKWDKLVNRAFRSSGAKRDV